MRRWGRSRGPESDGGRFAERAAWMVGTQLEARGVRDPEVLNAMRLVPRERFVPTHLAEHAYDDNALPIGRGQTISQPYIVARMTEALALPAWREAHPDQLLKVLDVGTGSGYQAAVLAQMGAIVISIERDPDLALDAERRLEEVGLNVKVIVGDGSRGVPDEAPFAGVVVAAASPDVPQPLVDQLAPDGRLVVPVGTRWEQRIKLVHRVGDEVTSEWLEPAVFVPLLGEHGFPER